MYRLFTIIGMNRKKEKLFYVLGILALAAGKLWYYTAAGREIADSHGYFAEGVIRLREEGTIFFSGLACVYMETLSDIFLFVGNRIEAVGVCQLLFQVIWLALLFAGLGMVFGKAAGALTAGILAFSPWIGETLFEVTPENFYMLHFSAVTVILGFLSLRMRYDGWYANKWEALYLFMAGFYTGLVCFWNYLGFFLCLPAGYLLVKAYLAYAGKTPGQRSKDCEKKKSLQVAALAAGLLLGVTLGFFTALLVDAGLTETTAARQLARWFRNINQAGGRSQDMDMRLIFWVAGGMLAGIFSKGILWCLGRKKATGGVEEVAEENKTAQEQEQGNYIVTQDGRRIRLLDNPLPGPKKHVKRKMCFDIEDVEDIEELADIDMQEETKEASGEGGETKTLKEQGRDEAKAGQPEKKSGSAEAASLQTGFREDLSGEEDDFDFQISQGDDFDL